MTFIYSLFISRAADVNWAWEVWGAMFVYEEEPVFFEVENFLTDAIGAVSDDKELSLGRFSLLATLMGNRDYIILSK